MTKTARKGLSIDMIENEEKTGKRDNALGLIAANIAMIAAIVLIIYITPKLVPFIANTSPDVDRQMAFVKGDILYYVDDMTARDIKPVPVVQIKGNADADNFFAFSGDGKYLYFRNDIDSRGKGSLCRIYIPDIRNDIIINENCVTLLAKEIVSFVFPEGKYSDHVIMKSAKGDLSIYDGEKITAITSKCDDYVLSKNGVRVFFHTRNGEVGFYNIRKKTTVQLAQLDPEKDELWQLSAGDMIYRRFHDGLFDIYRIDVKEVKTYPVVTDCVFLAGWDEESGDICYITSQDDECTLYSMVDDLWNEEDYTKSADAGRYMSKKPVDVYDAVGKTDAKYYKKHEKKLKAFYKKLINEGEKIDGYDDLRLYERTADGVSEYFVYGTEDKKWHEFDLNGYNEAIERIRLKEALETETYLYSKYMLHIMSQNGAVYDVADGICLEDARFLSGGIALYKQAAEPTLMSMDDIHDVSDVRKYYREYPYEIPDELMYATVAENGVFDMEGDYFLAERSPDSQYLIIYSMTGDAGSVVFENAGLFTLQDGKLSKIISKIDCNGKGAWKGDEFYFPVEGELRQTQKDKMKIVMDDTDFPVYRYELGLYLAMRDVQKNEGSLFLVTDGGEWIEISENVTIDSYSLIYDDQIVYISDGNLNVFMGVGKESVNIASDVKNYTCFGIKPEFVISDGFY